MKPANLPTRIAFSTAVKRFLGVAAVMTLTSSVALADSSKSDSGDDIAVKGRIYSHWSMDLDSNDQEFDLDRAYLTVKRELSDTIRVRLTTDVGRIKNGADHGEDKVRANEK